MPKTKRGEKSDRGRKQRKGTGKRRKRGNSDVSADISTLAPPRVVLLLMPAVSPAQNTTLCRLRPELGPNLCQIFSSFSVSAHSSHLQTDTSFSFFSLKTSPSKFQRRLSKHSNQLVARTCVIVITACMSRSCHVTFNVSLIRCDRLLTAIN